MTESKNSKAVVYTIEDLQNDFGELKIVDSIHIANMIHCTAMVKLKAGQDFFNGLNSLGFNIIKLNEPYSAYQYLSSHKKSSVCFIEISWNGDIEIGVTQFKDTIIGGTHFILRRELRANAQPDKKGHVQDYGLIR